MNATKRENEFEWNQFIKLGDMMGDGLHHEEPWIAKEYKKLAKILIPDLRETEKKRRVNKNESINLQIAEKLKADKCNCGSDLKQVRSGSKVVQCINKECNKKYTYKSKKR